MILISLCIAFVGWLLVCCWKITHIAAKNALNEAENGNLEPLNTLTRTEGDLKS